MKAWGNLPFSLRRENTENAVANATRVHPWDVKNKTGSRVQTIPRDIPSSTDVPVLLLNHKVREIAERKRKTGARGRRERPLPKSLLVFFSLLAVHSRLENLERDCYQSSNCRFLMQLNTP